MIGTITHDALVVGCTLVVGAAVLVIVALLRGRPIHAQLTMRRDPRQLSLDIDEEPRTDEAGD